MKSDGLIRIAQIRLRKLKLLMTDRPVIRNFSVLTISNLLVNFLGLVSSVRTTRILAPNDYGFMNVFNVKVSILAILGSVGIRNIVIRSVAREHKSSTSMFNASLLTRFVTTVAVLLAYFLYTSITHENLSSIFFYILIAQLCFSVLGDIVESVAFGLERMELSAVLNVSTTLIFVVCLYILPKSFWDVERILTVGVVLQLVKFAMYYLVLRNLGFVKLGYPLRQTSEVSLALVRESYPYYVLAIFTMLSTQIPILFLEARSGTSQVAFYNLGYKILNPLQMALGLALVALFPNMSRVYVEDKARFQTIVYKALVSLAGLGILGSFIMSFFRKEIVLVLYDQRYAGAAAVIAFQCWYTVWFAIFSLIGTVIGAMDKQRVLPVLSFSYALVSVPILWIGSSYGAIGLSMSYILVSLVNMTYHWFYFAKILPERISAIFSFLLFCGLIGAMGVSMAIPENLTFIWKLVIFVGVAIVLYFVFKHRRQMPFAEYFYTSNRVKTD